MRLRHPAFWRYTAFQIPGWLLASIGGWWIYTTLGVPVWMAAGVLIGWVIKDYALYPVLRSAYEVDDRRPIEYLIGAEGIAVEPLEPTGYIRVRGELWRATRQGSTNPVEPVERGHVVEVTAVEGTTLVVRST